MSEQWYESGRYYRQTVLRFGDCTPEGQAGIYAIMKLLSEMAGDDYEGKGLGHGVLAGHGQAFLLSRLGMNIHRMPRYTEQIVASTWERGAKGVFFFRDFEIKSDSGEKLISATSQWFIVNPESREILRPAELFGGLGKPNPDTADCPPCPRIAENAALLRLGERPVYYSDLDANGHVNNAVYGRIAQDFLPEEYRKKTLSRFFIEFKTETLPGDTLYIKGAPGEAGFDVQGTGGGKLHFGAKFDFE